MNENKPLAENETYVSEMGDLELKKVDIEEEDSKRNKRSNSKKKNKGFFHEWGIPLIVAVVLALLINKFLIFKVWIPSGSMEPTLNIGDRLFVSRVYKPENLKRGDIVVFYSDEKQQSLIKRLIGLPGDEISIKDGVITINGEVFNEDHEYNKDMYTGDFKVPEGKYFFLGDNRPLSYDSRYWINPFIDGDKIDGKAQLRVYPFSDFGWVK